MPSFPAGPLDTPSLPMDGDNGFVGFRSSPGASTLPPGIAAFLGNMRCDGSKARPRKGSKALSTDLELDNPPVVLPFTLAPDVALASLTRAGAVATATSVAPHGYSTGDWVAIEHAVQTEYNGDYEITVTGASTFTYAIVGTPVSPATGTITANRGPRLFETYDDVMRDACEYSTLDGRDGIVIATTDRAFAYRDGDAIVEIAYPADEQVEADDEVHLEQALGKVYLVRGYQRSAAIAVTSITRAGAVATVTTTAAHGQSTGEWVFNRGAGQGEYNGIFQITVTGASTFTFAVTGTPASPATGTITSRPCKPPLQWDRNDASDFVTVPTGYNVVGGTFIHMPPVSWLIQAGRRLVLPYEVDEAILSGLGEPATYDKAYTQLKFIEGLPDKFVAALQYQLLKILLLCENSVHVLLINSADNTISLVEEITSEVGCAARRTVAVCGDVILWLSTKGVQQMPISNELTLKASQLPLSDRIQNLIDGINWAEIAGAVSKSWNNRYYFAVPTGSSTRNNTVFVYNFISREWESVDTYPGDMDIKRLIIINYQGRKRLHALTTFGYIFLLEELEADEWGLGDEIGSYPVAGRLVTRDYYGKDTGGKRYTEAEIAMNVQVDDAYDVRFITRNPDVEKDLFSSTATAATDKVHRPHLRGRGAAVALEIETTEGRPEITRIAISAVSADRTNRERS